MLGTTGASTLRCRRQLGWQGHPRPLATPKAPDFASLHPGYGFVFVFVCASPLRL